MISERFLSMVEVFHVMYVDAADAVLSLHEATKDL
jgi:hypothetical protein